MKVFTHVHRHICTHKYTSIPTLPHADTDTQSPMHTGRVVKTPDSDSSTEPGSRVRGPAGACIFVRYKYIQIKMGKVEIMINVIMITKVGQERE